VILGAITETPAIAETDHHGAPECALSPKLLILLRQLFALGLQLSAEQFGSSGPNCEILTSGAKWLSQSFVPVFRTDRSPASVKLVHGIAPLVAGR
jgi:hypothetical protein